MSKKIIYLDDAIDIVVFECGKWTGLAKEISKQLKQLQSADVQPVVHGVWIKIEDHTYRCSECGKSIITNCDYIREHKFCFRCGAKMDGKGADNEID